ncbi:NeuD/PglB/VioB family sugar acetyltransferase [Zavarzinia compransoris]|uniref:NeuD/PglB/VioB family sugar acetyltransferase n=1 Tax=Zavarzinia marina TaxID=2911065 RepID=UPI001EEF0F4B|nr:NeuD/PglB/VioB family sugar acetyltransferase [Zavarzinia marina]MCF4167509.1 NeuD/PglB/VioB family sugar acetyltransferase [Zavarzinia marina]
MSGAVILWGATGQARVLRAILAAAGTGIEAVFDRSPVPAPWDDAPLFVGEAGYRQWRAGFRGDVLPGLLVAIGGSRGRDRLEIAARLGREGHALPEIRHAAAVVEPFAETAPGCQILAGAVLAAGAVLGEQCILNTNAGVDHDCRLGPGCHVGPGATLCGEVVLGINCFVGAGAVVLPRIRIGDDAVIGAGAVVTRDVAPGAVVVGNPARVQEPR